MSVLEGQGNSPLMQRERQRICMVRQSFAGVSDAPGDTKSAQSARRALTVPELAFVAMLPSSVRVTVARLLESGWYEFARGEMKLGRNPGVKPWQRILCQGLLVGGISRGELQVAFEQRLDLTRGSAKVRASTAIAVFTAGRLVVERQGRLVLSRN